MCYFCLFSDSLGRKGKYEMIKIIFYLALDLLLLKPILNAVCLRHMKN